MEITIIYGMRQQPVIQVRAPVLPPCEVHCAAHGDGPYFCCRCGAAFMPDESATDGATVLAP